MRLTFNKSYFFIAIVLFIIEVLIALVVKDKFVRPYVGDVLVVILIYCFIKSFLDARPLPVAIVVLIFAFTIELLQCINVVKMLGLNSSSVARTVIGTLFEWYDLVAYVTGIVLVISFEHYLRRPPKESQASLSQKKKKAAGTA